MREQYRKTEPWKAEPLPKPVPDIEILTPELVAKFAKVETIAHDDPNAICTEIGGARWRAYAKEQRERMKAASSS